MSTKKKTEWSAPSSQKWYGICIRSLSTWIVLVPFPRLNALCTTMFASVWMCVCVYFSLQLSLALMPCNQSVSAIIQMRWNTIFSACKDDERIESENIHLGNGLLWFFLPIYFHSYFARIGKRALNYDGVYSAPDSIESNEPNAHLIAPSPSTKSQLELLIFVANEKSSSGTIYGTNTHTHTPIYVILFSIFMFLCRRVCVSAIARSLLPVRSHVKIFRVLFRSPKMTMAKIAYN